MGKADMPEWARKLEDWGEKLEAKFDKFDDDIEKKVTKAKKPKWERKGEYVGSIFGNIIALFIVNMAPVWFPDFFTSSYAAVLSVMQLVIILTIVGNIILFIYSPKFLYYLLQSLMNALSVISIITIVTIFPFSGFGGLENLVKIALTISAVIIAVLAFFYFLIGLISLFNS